MGEHTKLRRTDEAVVVRPVIHILAAQNMQTPDSSTEGDPDDAIRERVHGGVQPAIHDREHVEEQERNPKLIRLLGD